MKIESRLVKKHNDKTGKSEYALISKKSGRVLKWFGVQKPSHERVMKEERRVQYFKHAGGELDIVDDRFQEIPRNQWDATPHTPYSFQYPNGFPLEDVYYEYDTKNMKDEWEKTPEFTRPVPDNKWPQVTVEGKYPTVMEVLATPLPKHTKPEQWEHTFDKIASVRPGKRLGVEFKTYVQFHRKEFPKGKPITDQDIARALEMSPEEVEDLQAAWDYLLSRKVVRRSPEVGNYRLL